MKDKTTLLKLASIAGFAGLLLAACGGGGDGDSDLPPGADPDDGGNSDSSESAAYWVSKDWKGCDVLDDLQSVQDEMGVTKLKSDLQSDGINEGIDAEGEGCSGIFALATFTFDKGDTHTETTGDANIWSGFVPWEDSDTASQNFKDRVDQWKASDIKLSDEKEGELGGDWDESYYRIGDADDSYHISAIGRHGPWLVYITMDYLHDPGVSAYNYNKANFPGKTAEDLAVYPFTNEELVDWITNTYMPQTQSDILDKIESEQ